MTNDDDERERAAERQKRHAAVFQNAKNELEKLENEHLEALEVIDEVNAHLTSRWPKSHDGLSSANCRELLRSIKRLEEAEKRVSDIERIDLTSLTTRKKNKTSSECHTKKKEEQSSAMTATTTTTKGAKCMAIKRDGAPCDKHAQAGFLTCRYQKHRAQEQELREKSGVPRTDSTESIQDTATNVNAQAPPPTQPPVVTRKGSRLKPPGVTKKRKRGDEEELEHTDHSPDEIVPDCPACAAGCGELTQPTFSPILHSEQAYQRDYSFDSPEPEVRIPRGLPPSPTLNGPIRMVNPIDNHDELMEELERQHKRKADEEAKAKRKAKEEAEAKRKAEEEEEAKRRAEEEKRKTDEEEKRKAEEEKRRAEEAKRKADEESRRKAEEADKKVAKRKAEAERKAEEEETMRKAEEDDDTETEDEEDDYSGPDGLINAIEDGKTKIAIDLIRNSNVDVNYTSEKEITALHAVVRRKKCDMGVLEALLLDENPNVNAQDAKGWTPLHRAALSKHEEAVKILLRAGADPFAKNKQGDTPLETICRYDHSSLKCITGALKKAEEENKGKPSIRPRRECTRTRDRAKTSTGTKSESTGADVMQGARDLTRLKNASSSNMKQIMENYDKTDDNRLEELCKKLRESVIPKTIEEFIKFHKFTLPVSVVKGRFEEYKITCQKPYSGDMSGAIAARLKKLEHDARVYKADAELFGPR